MPADKELEENLRLVPRKEHFLDEQSGFSLRIQRYTGKGRPANSLAYHTEFEIHLVKRGQGSYFIRNQIYHFNSRTLVVIPGNIPHRFIPHGDAFIEKDMLLFSLDLAGKKFRKFTLPEGFPHVIGLEGTDEAAIDLLIHNIEQENSKRESGWNDILALELGRLLLLILRYGGREPRAHKENPVVDWVLEYIEKNYRENIHLDELAAKTGYSRFHLGRIFKLHTQLGIKQYILQRRILEARRLLENESALSVETVGRRVGFYDFAHFNRVFKKITEMTPAVFRTFVH